MYNHTKLVYVILAIITTILAIFAAYGRYFSPTPKPAIVDQPLHILNRVPFIDGPALYTTDTLTTSIETCNNRKDPVTVIASGSFVKESIPKVTVSIDTSSLPRDPGCYTIIRMSPGAIADRGLSPGVWHIDGSRVVMIGDNTIQTIQVKSESFIVLAPK